jgi:hypothetical protein
MVTLTNAEKITLAAQIVGHSIDTLGEWRQSYASDLKSKVIIAFDIIEACEKHINQPSGVTYEFDINKIK